MNEYEAHNLQGRTVSIIENGSWAPTSGKLLRAHLEKMKNMTVLEDSLTLKSALKEDQAETIEKMAQAIVASLA